MLIIRARRARICDDDDDDDRDVMMLVVTVSDRQTRQDRQTTQEMVDDSCKRAIYRVIYAVAPCVQRSMTTEIYPLVFWKALLWHLVCLSIDQPTYQPVPSNHVVTLAFTSVVQASPTTSQSQISTFQARMASYETLWRVLYL